MEHKFEIPNKPLHSEKFKNETGFDLFIKNDELFISGNCTKEQAQTALANHDGSQANISLEQKLAFIGLNLDELKAILGL